MAAAGGKWLARLHSLSAGCAKLPLLAGLALVVSARIIPVLSEPASTPVVPVAALAEPTSHDAALIDEVLAKRAPDLGLTLRRQLGQAIAEEAKKTNYDPLLILALIDVESDFEEEAISMKGARGLMQIRPSTLHFLAEKEGLRLSREEVAADPALCVRLGIRYLRTLQERFGVTLRLDFYPVDDLQRIVARSATLLEIECDRDGARALAERARGTPRIANRLVRRVRDFAQVEGSGLTCFLVPRLLPDGSRNVFRLQRLKDKLGNRSNASAEVEFEDTVGWAVGDPGRGLRTILEMVRMTRLDCVLGSAATMRAAVAQAVHHATHRSAFGGPLRDKPAMAAVLADLALESEAATALGLRLAEAVDAGEDAFGRLATAVAKFWVCKRTPAVVGEALECLGGNGYVEDSGLPRLFRESPLNSIWEGSGNVIALDVLRVLAREPAAVAAVRAELALAAGADPRLDAVLRELADLRVTGEAGARSVATRLALALQASLLVRYAPAPVADAFCATRLPAPPAVFGLAVPSAAALVARAAPVR